MFNCHTTRPLRDAAADDRSSSTRAPFRGVKLAAGLALLLVPIAGAAERPYGWLVAGLLNAVLGVFFRGFNWAFDQATKLYGHVVTLFLRLSVIALLVYGCLIGLTVLGFRAVPTGFIPQQDKGYLVVNA